MRSLKIVVATVVVAAAAFVLSVGASAGASAEKVLICGANATYNSDVQARLAATGRFDEVDVYNCGSSSPTNAHVAGYDAVLVIYSTTPLANPGPLGTKLADFADGGGRVVEAAFDFWPAATLGGRWSQQDYSAFDYGTGAPLHNSPMQYVADLPTSPLLDGTGTFKGGPVSYHLNVRLNEGAVLVAHWADDHSTPLEADGPHSISLNFRPPASDNHDGFWDESTDGTTLLANALDPPPVTEADLGFSHVAVCTNKPVLRVADGSWGMFADIDIALWSASKHDSASPYFGSRPAIEVQGYGLMCDLNEVATYGGNVADFTATGATDGYYPLYAHK
jgi:hypothetical protein